MASSAGRPSLIQCRYQASTSSCEWPSSSFRYLSTRRLLSGWMSQAIASDIATTCARSAPLPDQRLVGIAQVEIIEDRQALGEMVAVDLEHRHQALRIERAIVGGRLLVFAQVDLAALIIHALEIEGDAHAVGGGRTEIIVEDRAGHAGCLLCRDERRHHLRRHADRPARRLVDDRPLGPARERRLSVGADEFHVAVEPRALAAPRRPRSAR